MTRSLCDIHMHLIPGVDDGSASMEMSLVMLMQARDQGIREVFATPHSSAFDHCPQQVRENFRALQETAARIFPDMEIFSGCEVLCDPWSMDATLAALDCGKYPSLNGTPFVLTEFSPWGTAEEAVRCTDALRSAGWIPVIAHAERYPFWQNQRNWIPYLRETGCLFQINAYSLDGEQDPHIRTLARELVREHLADFLGTDAHRTGHRPPRAEAGGRWITENCDEIYARRLLRENALQLLIGKEGA